MAKQTNILTDAAIKNLGAGRHSDGDGLYLQITAKGSASWQLLYTFKGNRREMGLGSYPAALSIADARKLATKLRAKVANGIDPIAEREEDRASAKRSTVKFTEVLDTVIKMRKPTWTKRDNGTYEQEEHWRSSISNHAPKIEKMLIADVTEQHVVEALDAIWLEHNKVAENLRQRLFLIFEEAIEDGLYKGLNPARFKRNIARKVGAKIPAKLRTKKHPAMPARDVPEFMAELRRLAFEEERLPAQCLYFIILTGVRSGEARGARLSEIDFDERVWTIPASRMKAKVEHNVPLSDEAMELVDKLSGRIGTDLLFPGKFSGGIIDDSVMYRLLCGGGYGDKTTFGLKGRASVHGFRATFRTWAAKQKRWTEKAMEQALAHAYGNSVQNAYDRADTLDERRDLLQAWGQFCVPAEAPAGNVVRFPSKKAA